MDGMLSQEEINALLGGLTEESAPAASSVDDESSQEQHATFGVLMDTF